jgi:hypothetical protein
MLKPIQVAACFGFLEYEPTRKITMHADRRPLSADCELTRKQWRVKIDALETAKSLGRRQCELGAAAEATMLRRSPCHRDAAFGKLRQFRESGNSFCDRANSGLGDVVAEKSVARGNNDLRDRLVNHHSNTAERIDRIKQTKVQSRSSGNTQ